MKVAYEARHTVDIDELTDFQGDVKVIRQENLDRLRRSIATHGFIVPMFVWRKTAKSKTYVIDGHQRLKALQQMRDEGEEVPPVPIEFIPATSRKDAATKLLAITSQFGEFDVDNLEAWATALHLDLPVLDIRLVDYEIDLVPLEIDIDSYFATLEDEALPGPKVIVCPHCGKEIEL